MRQSTAAKLSRCTTNGQILARHRCFLPSSPLALDGSDSPRTQGVRQVAKNLAAETALPIVFWDERLSTVAVERGMIEADLSRARRAELIDKAAAAYILQGLLDWLSRKLSD